MFCFSFLMYISIFIYLSNQLTIYIIILYIYICSVGFWIIGILLSLITVPVIAYFVYSVIKDPITPSVIQNAIDVWKEKYFGYISEKDKNSQNSHNQNDRNERNLHDTESQSHIRNSPNHNHTRNNIVETPRSLNMRNLKKNRSNINENENDEEYREGM